MVENATTEATPETENACRFCGRTFHEDVDRKAKIGGRKKLYCDADCRKLNYWLNKALETIEGIAEIVTPAQWAAIRGKLWRALNSRAWNRGVKRDAENRPRAPWVNPKRPGWHTGSPRPGQRGVTDLLAEQETAGQDPSS